MRIAVTGSSGFVGRALVSRIRMAGISVVSVTRCVKPPEILASDSYCGDYLDVSRLACLFQGCDVVIHLAARAHRISGKAVPQELSDFRSANVSSLISVAKASCIAGVRRLVFVSSIGVNGAVTSGRPFTEEDLPCPVEPYALTKLEAERALAEGLSETSMDWVILRPPLVYGPGCPGNLHRMILLASSAAILPFGALHARRTLISIDNLIDALLIAAHHPAVSRRTFVVADSQDIDVAGMLQVFLLGLGRGTWRLLPVPPFLIGFLLLLLGKKALWQKFSGELRVDSSAFQRATGWVPQVCPRDGLRNAAASLR